MSYVVDIISANKSKSIKNVENAGFRWIGLDKFKKLIYGLVFSGKKIQLVARCIFGGDAIFLQHIEVDGFQRYKSHYVATVGEDNVAVAVDDLSCIYLFSLVNENVERYEVWKPFWRKKDGGNVLLNHGLYYSSSVGFFCMIGNGCHDFVYGFIFDDAKKVFQAELVTKYPYSVSLVRSCANDQSFSVFTADGDTLHTYDFAEKIWSKVILRDAPKHETHLAIYIEGITRSAEGETVALFYFKYQPNYTLYKLVGDVWQCYMRLSSNFCSQSRSIPWLMSGVFYIGIEEKFMVAVNPKALSLKDIALRKVVGCWNCNGSFKSFLVALNLPTLMKRHYFGIISE